MTGYDFDPHTGWTLRSGDPSFKPRDLTFTYTPSFSRREIIRNRLFFSLNLNSKLFYDLQRYTSSKFDFSLGFTLGINKFLDLSLSANSENAVIFRYFKNVPVFRDNSAIGNILEEYPDGDQNNLFIDLFDSFNFADEEKRRRTGFKLKGFRLNAVHHLGDWNAVLGVTMNPYLPPGSSTYKFSSDVTFLIQWVPISEIKSDIKYENRHHRYTVQ
jgi:hypothetical protein